MSDRSVGWMGEQDLKITYLLKRTLDRGGTDANTKLPVTHR